MFKSLLLVALLSACSSAQVQASPAGDTGLVTDAAASVSTDAGAEAEAPLPAIAPGTDTDFSFTLATTAEKASIWNLWRDVQGWPRWDIVESARIDGPFQLGTRGASTSDGMESAFEVTAFVDKESYEITFPLPGGTLVIQRFFERDTSRTVFTHRVRFTGDGGLALAPSLAPGFRAALPRVMDSLRRLAEGK